MLIPSEETSIQVQEICEQLIQCVKITLNPNIISEERRQAYEFIEKIKDDSKYAMPCGFYLWTNSDACIKHLGLQLLEETVQYHWNDLSIEEKLQIKNNGMQLLANGFEEQVFIKNKISCLLVEMAKREWPQQWPDFLDELKSASSVGTYQAELVLLVLMRLVEDAVVLQNMNASNRKHDIHMALNQNLNFFFDLFFDLLERHYTQYKLLETDQTNQLAAASHCRVTQIVYETLALFGEWAPIEYVMNHKEKLFYSICQLISDKHVRQSAANCFLRIVSKKCKSQHLLILFDQSVMDAIFGAARLAVLDEVTEENYIFLKTLFQVLTTLGTQLCGVWGKEPEVKEPTSFPIYLNAVLSFVEHPSFTIFHHAALLFIQLLKHDLATKCPSLEQIYPRWIELAGIKMKKHGYPSRSDSETCKYSSLDFDNDSEYNLFFHQVRSNAASGIKFATGVYPAVSFAFVDNRFHKCVQTTEEISSLIPATSDLDSNSYILTPLQAEWDALAVLMEAVLPRLLVNNKYESYENSIKNMFSSCLKHQTSDVVISSSVLSCISALCSYLPVMPQILPMVIEKLFSTFQCRLPSVNKSRMKPVLDLRNHACAVYILLCKNYPQLMVVHLDTIDSMVSTINGDAFDSTSLEKCHLAQGLVMLNNYIQDFARQEAFLAKVLSSRKQDWLNLSDGINGDFVSFIGLDQAPIDKEPNKLASTTFDNRQMINRCLNYFQYVIRGVKRPVDKIPEGGSHLAYRSPLTQNILPLLPNLFGLFKSHNNLFESSVMNRFAEEYKKSLDIPTCEQLSLLNLHSQNQIPLKKNDTESYSATEKMSLFLKVMYEHLCECTTYLSSCLNYEFYQIPNLREVFINSVLLNFTLLPDFKMKKLVKTFRGFATLCPVEFYETLNLPIIHHFCVNMNEFLNKRWEYVSSVTQSDYYDENASEMIDLVLIQAVTRDYLDTLKDLIIVKKKSECENSNGISDDANLNAGYLETDCKPTSNGSSQLSPLAKMMFGCDSIFQAIVLTVCKSLSWNDSLSSRKANDLLNICVLVMMDEGQQHLTEEVVKHMFISVLAGIHRHGQDPYNLSIMVDTCLLLYEKLALHFPVLRHTLLNLPSVNEDVVISFENTLANKYSLNQNKAVKGSKTKKDALKKVINGIIGKNISEAFQKEVQIKDLPPMFQKPRPKQPRLDEGVTNLDLCQLFNPSSTN